MQLTQKLFLQFCDEKESKYLCRHLFSLFISIIVVAVVVVVVVAVVVGVVVVVVGGGGGGVVVMLLNCNIFHWEEN